MHYKKIALDMILDLFDDGGTATAAGSSTAAEVNVSNNTGAQQGSSMVNTAASAEEIDFARQNGIPERLAKEYSEAKRKIGANAEVQASDGESQQKEVSTEPQSEPNEPSFSEMVKDGGKFHDDFQKMFDDNFNRRVKTVREQNTEMSKKLESFSKIAEQVSLKYGIDPNNVEELANAVQSDNDYITQLASDNGMTVEEQTKQLNEQRKMRDMEAELNRFKSQQVDLQTKNYLDEESAKVKAVYPEFDITSEISSNPEFAKALAVTKQMFGKENVQLAYEISNKDKLVGGVVDKAGEKIQEAMAKQLNTTGRPKSNANMTGSTAPQEKKFSAMSSKEIADLAYEAKSRGISVMEIMKGR